MTRRAVRGSEAPRRAARRRAVLVSASLVRAASGCTRGSDGRVVVAGDTSEQTVLAAIEATRATTGRFDMVVEPIGSQDFRGEVEGEFAGPDHLVEVRDDLGSLEYDDRTDAGEPSSPSDDADPLQGADRLLHADDRSFVAFDSVLFSSGMVDEDGPIDDDVELDERIEWLDTTDLGSSDEHDLLATNVSGTDLFRPFALLDELEAIESDGAAELDDGTPTRRYTATISGERFFAAMGMDETFELYPGAPADAELTAEELEDQRRLDAIVRYGVSRTSLDVELHVDADGRLRRTVMSVRTDTEARYSDCLLLQEFVPLLRMSADYSELGSDIEVEVPDATAVIEPDEAIERYPDYLAVMDAEEWEEALASEDLFYDEDGNPRTVTTVHGERVLFAVEDDLLKFGSVIDLDEDDVWEMTPEQMVEAYDRATAVLDGMPRTTTAMGDLTRVELLFNVQTGMEEEGVDPASAASMTDQQLGALIDQYVAELGIAGDGVWGDPKVGDVPPEWWEEELGEGGYDDPDDLFESCPGDAGGEGEPDGSDPASEPATFD